MSIGKRIRERREELGLTQEELATRMGYTSKSTINKIETGKNDIPQKKIAEFAKVLDTDVAYLMEWNTEEPEPVVFKVPHMIFSKNPPIPAREIHVPKEGYIPDEERRKILASALEPIFEKMIFATDDEKELLGLYSRLNEEGKDKLFDYLLDLLDMPKYVLTDAEIEKQVEEYRKQLEAESDSKGKSSASSGQKEA